MATPLAALDLNRLADESEHMSATDPGKLMRAATAMCLYPNLDRDTLITSFGHGGWNVAGDGEWIEMDLADVWVTLLGPEDDFFCDVQGDISQAEAVSQIRALIANTVWENWTEIPGPKACTTFEHPSGLAINISSAGNDPTCDPQPNAGISISFAENSAGSTSEDK
ncbi:MAG: hypothetical protein GY952_05370 [Rhodobacteraceae bacterium]|nr:hypothetical protein [Paracoccaceae bacterium]